LIGSSVGVGIAVGFLVGLGLVVVGGIEVGEREEVGRIIEEYEEKLLDDTGGRVVGSLTKPIPSELLADD